MSEKVTVAEGVKDGVVLVVSALGLTMEPHVFVACILLSAAGAVVGRGFTPEMAHRRAFGLTLAAGVFFTVVALLLDQVASGAWGWWIEIPPQLISMICGAIGPLAIALLMKKFPMVAERFLGKYLPQPVKKPQSE